MNATASITIMPNIVMDNLTSIFYTDELLKN